MRFKNIEILNKPTEHLYRYLSRYYTDLKKALPIRWSLKRKP